LAVYRYFLGRLRDPEAAEELSQEFALRFLRGDFQGADPQRGRFRGYLAAVLARMASTYFKARKAQPRPLPAALAAPAADAAEPPADFRKVWRRVLLDRAWQALAEVQEKTGQPLHTALRLRVEHAGGEMSAAHMAEWLNAQLGRTFTAGAVRKLLQRAREKFREALLDEVSYSLEEPPPERLVRELRELGLLAYCRPALRRRGCDPG
jgi:RNA polymerase sigma-70 factor (ECF subfamily)